MTWRPIETVPEGTPVLLLCNEYKPEGPVPAKAVFCGSAYYSLESDDEGSFIGRYFSVPQPDCKEANWMDLFWEPTHWQPLPEPPKMEREDG